MIGVSVFPYDHGAIELVALRCTLVEGEPHALEHAALRWVTAAELATVDWAPADVGLGSAVQELLASAAEE